MPQGNIPFRVLKYFSTQEEDFFISKRKCYVSFMILVSVNLTKTPRSKALHRSERFLCVTIATVKWSRVSPFRTKSHSVVHLCTFIQ